MSFDYKVFSGLCPDENCQTKLYYAAHKTTIECPNCGQRHSQNNLHQTEEVTDGEEAITQVLKSIVWDMKLPKKGSDTVKVNGLSNYHCKILSPLFTSYGMDKAGNPRLLSELGHGDTADCGRLLCNRAFLISPEHIKIVGYGQDQSGSVQYLQELLDIIKEYNDDEELLLPIHADGDGHCLVHALSRATTGREIFWHALRENLTHHLESNLTTYKKLFGDFHDVSDWTTIIEEADPYHTSPDGFHVGLGNIHIFALANVLKRPIVLMDSMKGIENVADYTGIFVPALADPDQCRGHLPLCVAWSGAGHNHFVPLVGVAGRRLPCIPPALVPNIWGIEVDRAMEYLNFNKDGSLTVAGGKPLQKGYVLRLVSAMEQVFLERHQVSAQLVADMHLYVYKRVGVVGLHPDIAIERTRDAVVKDLLFHCLICNALTQANVDSESLQPGGSLFKLMLSCHEKARTDKIYDFPFLDLRCKYNAEQNCLVPNQICCSWCNSDRTRRVDKMGKTLYENGDITNTPSTMPNSCCSYKHYWDNKEYDNVPKVFEINVTLDGKKIVEQVTWFFEDSDPALNSNSSNIAHDITQRNFEEPDRDKYVLKIDNAICSRLKDFGLPYDRNEKKRSGIKNEEIELKMKSKTGHSDRTKVEIEGSNKSDGYHGDGPSTSKRVVMKREVDGTIKPPSPPVHHNKGPVSGSVAVNKSSVMGESKVTAQADCKGSRGTPKASSSTVKVRVSTSNGRQEVLLLPADMNYEGLRTSIEKHFQIPPKRQIIKYGFPPKLFKPESQENLGLRNGDKIMVEVKEKKIPSKVEPKNISMRPMISIDKDIGNLQSFVELLPKTLSSHNYGTTMQNFNDVALDAVSKMATITGKASVWDYAITHPELFLAGGAFYQQFSRDIGLIHGRHCMLPLMPGRIFRYNGEADRIELCLEPTGHYEIGPDIPAILDLVSNTSNPVPPSVKKNNESEEVLKDELAHSITASSSNNELADNDGALLTNENISVQSSALEKSKPVDILQPDMGDKEIAVSEANLNISQTLHDVQESLADPVDEEILPSTSKSEGSNIKTITKKREVAISKAVLSVTVPGDTKMAPGFTTVGSKPTEVTPEQARETRNRLVEVLKAKKETK